MRDFYEYAGARRETQGFLVMEWDYGLPVNEVEEYRTGTAAKRYLVSNPYYVKTKQERLGEIVREHVVNGYPRWRLLGELGTIDQYPGEIDPKSLGVMWEVFSLER
jgi:hypothetical protein